MAITHFILVTGLLGFAAEALAGEGGEGGGGKPKGTLGLGLRAGMAYGMTSGVEVVLRVSDQISIYGGYLSHDFVLTDPEDGEDSESSSASATTATASELESRSIGNAQEAGVRFHPFRGSFNLHVSAARLAASGKYSIEDSTTGASASYEAQYNQEFASLSLGNYWYRQNFMIGCDWFGFSRVINSSISEESSRQAGTLSPADQARLDKAVAHFKTTGINETMLIFLNFRIGFMF